MKKIALVVLALVLALGTLGVAYARWSDKVDIDVKVTTNTVTLGYTEFTCQEMYEELPWGSGLFHPGEWEGKDVGKVECGMSVLKTDPVTGLKGYGIGTITVTNGYPSYWVFNTFVVKNLGTTPVRILAWQPVDPTGELTWDEATKTLKDKAGCSVFKFRVVNLVGDQLHSGEENKAEIDFHVEQCALQKHTYTFNIVITGLQWNEWKQ